MWNSLKQFSQYFLIILYKLWSRPKKFPAEMHSYKFQKVSYKKFWVFSGKFYKNYCQKLQRNNDENFEKNW